MRRDWPGAKAALYMAALIATRYNKVIRDFMGVGKPKKLALTTRMRNMLTVLNVMVE